MSDCFDHEVDAFDSMEYDYHYGSPKYTSNYTKIKDIFKLTLSLL